MRTTIATLETRLSEQTVSQDDRLANTNTAFIRQANESIARLLSPLNETLQRYEHTYTQFEKTNSQVYGSLSSELKSVAQSSQAIRNETSKLVQALKSSPKTKGRWGEFSLQNVLELSGLSQHVDYTTQESFTRDDDRLRPDAIINLPNDRHLIVDSKASMAAYIDACEATTDEARQLHLEQHVTNVRTQLKQLADKAYWDSLVKTPDFVLMFIPGDNFYSAVAERDPHIFEEALDKRIIIVTPTTLIALAKAVSFGWRQVKSADQARQIYEAAQELSKRLYVMLEHVVNCGEAFNKSIEYYNKFVGSLEHTVMSQLRRFKDLSIEPANANIEYLETVDTLTRVPTLKA